MDMTPMQQGTRGAEADSQRGRLTFALLTDTRDFFLPPVTDAWGVSRGPFSVQLARLSAELAAGGYDLDIRPWKEAGWDDCTFVIEDRILPLDPEDDSRLARLEGRWKQRRAKSLIRGVNPVSDLLRAVRQLLVTDLGKCIVMTRTDDMGRRIIALSFIGTTQKYFDWFSNFKFQPDTGMHAGFLQLARRIDAAATRILLPKLARSLGEETYTLADAITDAKKPDGHTVLWISGHSQGGAIAQVYTHLLMAQGVQAANIRGYTFAAPTVAAADGRLHPKAYPLFNIISADDVVPRVGAQVRLGVDRLYRPDAAFRKRHYRVNDEHRAAFDRALFLQGQVQTTTEAICWFLAMVRLMGDMETGGPLEKFFGVLFPHASLLKRLNLTLPEVAAAIEAKVGVQHAMISGGEAPNEALVHAYQEMAHGMLRDFGPEQTAWAIGHCMGAPHRMRPDKHEEDFEPPYIGIARRHLHAVSEGVWSATAPAVCLDAQGHRLLPMPHRMPAARCALPEPVGAALPPAGAECPGANETHCDDGGIR